MDAVDRTPDPRGPLERPDTPAQWYAIAAGTFLLVLGILSLALRGVSFDGIDVLSAQPEFPIWSVSGWGTVLWIAGGAIGLLASARLDAARDYAATAGVVFTVVAVWGFLDGGDVAGCLFLTGGHEAGRHHGQHRTAGRIQGARSDRERRTGRWQHDVACCSPA